MLENKYAGGYLPILLQQIISLKTDVCVLMMTEYSNKNVFVTVIFIRRRLIIGVGVYFYHFVAALFTIIVYCEPRLPRQILQLKSTNRNQQWKLL
jgi:hypothetical protein